MKECITCNATLTPPKKKYCSNNCKAKHHWHTTKRQPNTYHAQTIRSLNRKLELIKIMGGSCVKCGYNNNIAALDFHHKTPSEKESKLDSRILANRTWEYIIKEANKCELLCSNCHREEHNPEMYMKMVIETVDSHILHKHNIKLVSSKPNCLDCGVEINYNSERCKVCNYINMRKVSRPDSHTLKLEILKCGYTWCANKYGVSRTTIKRWIIKKFGSLI